MAVAKPTDNLRFQLAVTDIAPNYTGNILAVMNTVSSCAGFVTPILTAEIVDGNVREAPLKRSVDFLHGSNYCLPTDL